jgi:hypothetical protein
VADVGAAVKLVTEYLRQAADFERMADEATDSALKQPLLEQAERYWKLANRRAIELGQPPPVRFRPSE